MDYKQITECRNCSSPYLRSYLNLGSHPLANGLLNSDSPDPQKYPVEVLFCEKCYLSQLSVVVKPEIMFKEYAYHSSVSNTFKTHCQELVTKLKGFETCKYPLVVDIASNDGCLLDQFKSQGFQRLFGVEPARNLTKTYTDRGICGTNQFWSENMAKSYRDSATQGASFITATNVFAHVDDIRDFLRGVRWFLDDKGVFVVEVPYLGNLIKFNQFDTVYHEHLSYFLIRPLRDLFESEGLPIFKVEKVPIHGGSIRIYASKSAHQIDPSVAEYLKEEEAEGLYDIDTYMAFAKRVDGIRHKFNTLMELLYRSSLNIVGFGASAKGISLLNYSDVSIELSAIVDDTPYKQGKFTPGGRIPIVDRNAFHKPEPDFILLLAWNFAKEMMEKTRFHKERGGHYIIPIPEVKLQ